MKKLYYTLAALVMAPAVIISVSNSAQAQRRNTTSHDVKTNMEAPMVKEKKECHCRECMKKCDKHMHKKHHKKHHKKDKKRD